jgi:hypothetical protein
MIVRDSSVWAWGISIQLYKVDKHRKHMPGPHENASLAADEGHCGASTIVNSFRKAQ